MQMCVIVVQYKFFSYLISIDGFFIFISLPRTCLYNNYFLEKT